MPAKRPGNRRFADRRNKRVVYLGHVGDEPGENPKGTHLVQFHFRNPSSVKQRIYQLTTDTRSDQDRRIGAADRRLGVNERRVGDERRKQQIGTKSGTPRIQFSVVPAEFSKIDFTKIRGTHTINFKDGTKAYLYSYPLEGSHIQFYAKNKANTVDRKVPISWLFSNPKRLSQVSTIEYDSSRNMDYPLSGPKQRRQKIDRRSTDI